MNVAQLSGSWVPGWVLGDRITVMWVVPGGRAEMRGAVSSDGSGDACQPLMVNGVLLHKDQEVRYCRRLLATPLLMCNGFISLFWGQEMPQVLSG